MKETTIGFNILTRVEAIANLLMMAVTQNDDKSGLQADLKKAEPQLMELMEYLKGPDVEVLVMKKKVREIGEKLASIIRDVDNMVTVEQWDAMGKMSFHTHVGYASEAVHRLMGI